MTGVANLTVKDPVVAEEVDQEFIAALLNVFADVPVCAILYLNEPCAVLVDATSPQVSHLIMTLLEENPLGTSMTKSEFEISI